ncbi:DnaD domain protein [Hydrogenibacillus schlegelii]|uniref:DnaD domain protein n=2 Tax=Hydrogenibacillus schlegelii TaxID=1484 RepID=UPI0034A0833A
MPESGWIIVGDPPALSPADRSTLADWYLPVIGLEAYGLYLALVDRRPAPGPVPAAAFYARLGFRPAEAERFDDVRRRLEGVGLLRTFAERPQNVLFLQLQSPLRPEQVAASDVLLALLIDRLGPAELERLAERYGLASDDRPAAEPGEEVTAPFREAYPEAVPARIVADLSAEARSLLRAIRRAGERRLAAVERVPGAPPSEVRRAAGPDGAAGPAPDAARPADPKAQFERHLRYLKSVSPYDLLRNYQGGGELSPADERLVRTILEEIGLPAEVTNVLIDYVLLVKDHKFPRAFTEKIAASWKRKGFQTAEEALAYARAEYRRQMKASARPTKGAPPRRTPAEGDRRRRLPAYIVAQLEAERRAWEAAGEPASGKGEEDV